MKSIVVHAAISRQQGRKLPGMVQPRVVLLAMLLVLGTFATALPALADGCIPYCNAGTIAPTNVFNAVATDHVTGYFVDKGPAGDTDWVRMLALTTNTTSDWFFNNQTSHVGDKVDFGAVNAGDLLVFELWNETENLIFASQPDLSADGTNHAYATQFSGGVLNGFDFPAGTYIGMEDLPNGYADWNYNDDSFIVTNVVLGNALPEPSSILMVGTGLLAVAGAWRRRLN
jgi:hypothetical protein